MCIAGMFAELADIPSACTPRMSIAKTYRPNFESALQHCTGKSYRRMPLSELHWLELSHARKLPLSIKLGDDDEVVIAVTQSAALQPVIRLISTHRAVDARWQCWARSFPGSRPFKFALI
jgi:hypothetical protein